MLKLTMAKMWILTLLGCVAITWGQYLPVVPPVPGPIPAGELSYYRIVPAAPQISYPTVPAAAAKCVLIAAKSSVAGEIELYQSSNSDAVEVRGSVFGLTPGLHGFHMHRDGNTGDDCKAAGPHFNPHNQTHGGPQDMVRHAGDFGNILALENGRADFQFYDSHISLIPGHIGYAVGHAIVVHAGEDDLGKGGNEESLKTGNAGGRLACCVVEAINYK
ncbi:hypothetical protein L9F63_004462 [Diploptera punctata]|uniref:Superoxide dismutase [Cu-Zn] n=1 Tax=Diploptera punctata TaxID=6984 RepID=A0AAD7ZFT5_DIPPU|nr:hypothetical protein L9F63_004462 [Diploptera punctata]